MWLKFINKENPNDIEYVNVSNIEHIHFGDEYVGFYGRNSSSHFAYDSYIFYDSFCDDIAVNDSSEEKFLQELLYKLSKKFEVREDE